MGVDAEMYVLLEGKLDENAVRKLGWELGQSFYRDRFFTNPEAKYGEEAHGTISIVKNADGEDDYLGMPNGALRVHLAGRYYGPGYERGPLTDYVAIAEWFERRFTNCKVYYGGDSGEGLSYFGPIERKRLLEHFDQCGHWPYMDNDTKPFRGSEPMQPTCDFCHMPCGTHTWFGGSGDMGASCPGCGLAYRYYASEGAWRQVDASEIRI